MMSPQNITTYERVINDIRKEFPLRPGLDYLDKIDKIITQRVWDVLADLESKYSEEVNEDLMEQAAKYGEPSEEIDE